ncbi:MAG: hypothetical protein NTY77_14960 [Elusimicrobia bacterium]|nr:hypothetical protein [Elusimicrobiota bacterium]
MIGKARLAERDERATVAFGARCSAEALRMMSHFGQEISLEPVTDSVATFLSKKFFDLAEYSDSPQCSRDSGMG